jgi:hypothetical protein
VVGEEKTFCNKLSMFFLVFVGEQRRVGLAKKNMICEIDKKGLDPLECGRAG